MLYDFYSIAQKKKLFHFEEITGTEFLLTIDGVNLK
jgi:hypothetical protein